MPGRGLDGIPCPAAGSGGAGEDLRAIDDVLDAVPSEPWAGGNFYGAADDVGVADDVGTAPRTAGDVEVPDAVSWFDIGDDADPPPVITDAAADAPQGPYRGRLPESADDFDFDTAMNTRPDHWLPEDVKNDVVFPPVESAMTRAYAQVHEDAVAQARRFDPEFSGTSAVEAHRRLLDLLDQATAAGDTEKASSIRTAIEELETRAHRTLYEGLLEAQNIYDNLPGLPSDVDSGRVRRLLEDRIRQAEEVFNRTGLPEDASKWEAWMNAKNQLDAGRDPRSLLSGVRTQAIGSYNGSPPEKAAIFQDIADEIGRMFDLRYFQVEGEETGSAFRFDDAVRQLQARASVAEEMVAHNAALDTLDNIDIAARSCLLHADDSLSPDDVAGLSAIEARARLVQKMNQAAESGDVDTAYRAQRMLDLLDAKTEEFIERYETLWVAAPDYEDLDEIRSKLLRPADAADAADDAAGRPLRDVGDAAGGEERSLDHYSDTARAPGPDSAEDPGYASFRDRVNSQVGTQDYARVPDEEPPGLASRGEVVVDGDGARVANMPEAPPAEPRRSAMKKKRRWPSALRPGGRKKKKSVTWGVADYVDMDYREGVGAVGDTAPVRTEFQYKQYPTYGPWTPIDGRQGMTEVPGPAMKRVLRNVRVPRSHGYAVRGGDGFPRRRQIPRADGPPAGGAGHSVQEAGGGGGGREHCSQRATTTMFWVRTPWRIMTRRCCCRGSSPGTTTTIRSGPRRIWLPSTSFWRPCGGRNPDTLRATASLAPPSSRIPVEAPAAGRSWKLLDHHGRQFPSSRKGGR